MTLIKCKHFGVCGGCKYQHLPYEAQLSQKQAFVNSCFDRAAEPILASDPFWHYRNKMEFSFAQSKKGEKFLGLMKQRGRVENLDECYLTDQWFIETLKQVRDWWQKSALDAYYPPANKGILRNLTLRQGMRTDEKMAILTISEAPFDDVALSAFIEAVGEIDALILRKQIIQKKRPTRFEERLVKGKPYIHELLQESSGAYLKFRIRGASFFQPNSFQAERLYQKAIACAELNDNELVLDLYCGTGSLGMFASRQAAHVLGIEIVPEAVQDAHANLKENGISNMEVLEGDVGEKLAHIAHSDVIFVDPPRVGLGPKTIKHLLALKPKKIVYVSCNPASQSADCANLSEYEVCYLQPIDQFPHTAHVENIALLRRKT
jgi:23S rRNA (uracil1939-C5)-methyltransferase